MSSYSIGQRVIRYSDKFTGVVTQLGPKGNVWVRWDNSGLQTVMVPLDIRPA